jgi:tetratricopeptide (TPR) repeat protein
MKNMQDHRIQLSLFIRLALPLLFLLAAGLAPRPANLAARLLDTQAAIRRGDYGPAAENLAALAADQPWRATLWEEAGRAALYAGDMPAAINHLEQARQAGRLSADGQMLLGDAYQFQGQVEQANTVWQALLATGEAASPGLYLRLADNQRLMNDVDGLEETLRQMLAAHPGQPTATYQLGLLLAAREPVAALPYLEQAAELDPSLEERTQELVSTIRAARFEQDAAYRLIVAGRALANLNEWRLADLAFTRAAEARPDYAEAWAYLGHAQERLGGDGQAALDQALELDPDSLAANLFAALHFAEAGRPELSLLYLHAAADLDPKRAEIQLELGNLLAEMGDLLSARRHYQKALDLAGSQAGVYRETAAFSVRYNVDVRELALPAARQAVLLEPKNPASLDTLGQVYFKLGDPVSAKRHYQRALKLDPLYAPAHLHLGLVDLLDGRTAEARQRFHQVLNLAPDSPAAVQAQRLLEGGAP